MTVYDLRHLAADRPEWHRQPRETASDHAKFTRWLAMVDRGLHIAAEELGMSYGSLRNLAAKRSWTERAAAWDADQARAAAEKLSAARRQMAEDHVAIARAMIARAGAAVLAIDPASLSPAEVARWLDVASKVQRTALGEPERTVAVTGPAGGPVRLEAVPATEAERIAMLRASAARIAELAGAADEQLAAADPAAFALQETE